MIEVYVEKDRLVVARDDVSIVINNSSFALTAQEQVNLTMQRYASTKVVIFSGNMGKRDGLTPIHTMGMKYEVGKAYSGRELINSPPPEGTIVLDEDQDALKLEDGQWQYGADTNPLYMDAVYRVIYLP